MGFFDTLGAPASAATMAPPTVASVAAAGTPPSFFDVLGAPAASVASARATARSLKSRPVTALDQLGNLMGGGPSSVMGVGGGLVHGLGEGWDQILRVAADANRLTGLGSLEHAIEPQADQAAFGRLQQQLTVDPSTLPYHGVGGDIGNFVGKAIPGTAAALATDGVTAAPEALSLGGRMLDAIPSNAAMGALWPSVHHTGLDTAVASVAGPAITGATDLAARGVAGAADWVSPFIKRAVQFASKPTAADAANLGGAYARSAVTPEDIEAVNNFHEAVPGVIHPPAVIAQSDAMQAQLAALRSRTAADVNNPVDRQYLGNLKAIHDYMAPVMGSPRPVTDTSPDMLSHLMQAKSAAHDVAVADRAPLDAVKPHIHVTLDGMKKAYDDVADSLGTHTKALLPDWLQQTFDEMAPGAKTSYQNAESLISRLNAESARAPADTTTNAILAKMRAGMKDALFNTTKFYDESGARLPGEYEGAVKDTQTLANKSWADYRNKFPNDGKTPARQFIRGATTGKINASEFANGVFRNPELFNAWKNAVSRPAESAGTDIVNNASSESAASMEAINRHASEQAAGRYRYGLNNDGSITPIYGVDAADQAPTHNQVIVQATGNPAKPYILLDHGKGVAPGRAQQIMADAEGQLKALDAQGGIPDDEGEAPRAKPQGKPKYDIRRARAAINARMDALDAAREPDPAAMQLAREHYARQLQDHVYDTRGRTLDQTPIINGNKMRDFRSDKPNGHAWAEKQLFKPDESTVLDNAQEAMIRNNKRYASIGKGQSPTEYLRQANKQAQVHPFVHVGAALSGHGIAPVALTKGFELLSNHYASQLQPMVDDQLERILTDPSAFLDAMGRESPQVKASLLDRLKGNARARSITRGAGHAAALLGALSGR